MLYQTRICDTLNKLGESIALSTCTIPLNLWIIALAYLKNFAQLQISYDQNVTISDESFKFWESEERKEWFHFRHRAQTKESSAWFFDLLEAPMVESYHSLFPSCRGNGLVSLYLEHRRRAKRMLIFVEQSRCISVCVNLSLSLSPSFCLCVRRTKSIASNG